MKYDFRVSKQNVIICVSIPIFAFLYIPSSAIRRSEGVKACMDLKVLSENAEFTIRIGDGVPVAQVPVLRMRIQLRSQ